MKKLSLLMLVSLFAFGSIFAGSEVKKQEKNKVNKLNIAKGIGCLALATLTGKMWWDVVMPEFKSSSSDTVNLIRDISTFPTEISNASLSYLLNKMGANPTEKSKEFSLNKTSFSNIASTPLFLATYLLAKKGVANLYRESKKLSKKAE